MALLENFIRIMEQQRIYDIYLPFLLTFAIFYALIKRTRVFGIDKSGRNISLLVSLIASAYIMIFSPYGISISVFFSTLFAETSVLLVTLLVFLMIVMMIAGPFWARRTETLEEIWKKIMPFALGFGLLLALGMFVSSGGISLFGEIIPPGIGIPGLSGEDVAMIVLLVITALIVFLVAREEPEDVTNEYKIVKG